MARQAAVVSYRLGGDDGVSVEARKWHRALTDLGFTIRRVAGAIEDGGEPDDVVLPELAIDAVAPARAERVVDAIGDADLVVVENICSLPLNLIAARAVASAVATTNARVVFRHHDLPWQRRHLAHLADEFPPRPEGALHATINLRSRRELDARGYACTHTVHNRFDLAPPPGARDATRAAFGFDPDDVVVFQPARAIERKNVPGGLRFASRLARILDDRNVRYWLSGPAEDGYEATLEKLLARADVEFALGRAPTAADAYAACDVVAFPSTWEGFGNPTIESIAARRPCAAFPYPVLAEILATGVRCFPIDEPESVARFLHQPEAVREQYHDVNLHRARLSFAIEELPDAIDEAFGSVGWHAW